MRRRREREMERRNLGDRRRGVRVFFLLVKTSVSAYFVKQERLLVD